MHIYINAGQFGERAITRTDLMNYKGTLTMQYLVSRERLRLDHIDQIIKKIHHFTVNIMKADRLISHIFESL